VGLMAPFDGLRAGFEVAPFQNADVFNGRALCRSSLVAEPMIKVCVARE
jgi:hypothetical protein